VEEFIQFVQRYEGNIFELNKYFATSPFYIQIKVNVLFCRHSRVLHQFP